MSEHDISYYEVRARQESEAAESAASKEAASAHRLLAIQYEAHARELREQQGNSKPAIGGARNSEVDSDVRRPVLSMRAAKSS